MPFPLIFFVFVNVILWFLVAGLEWLDWPDRFFFCCLLVVLAISTELKSTIFQCHHLTYKFTFICIHINGKNG